MASDILDPIDAALETVVDNELATIHRRGTRASQPAATAVLAGTLYAVMDEGHVLERSNGTAWEPYAPANPTGAVFPYGFGTATSEPPSAQTIRFDASHPYTGVTKLWATFADAVSEDLYWGWMRIAPESRILVQDKDEHTRYAEFETTGDPIDKGSYVELPVAYVGSGFALAAQAALIRVAPPSGPGPGAIVALEARVVELEARVAALEAARG